MFPRSDLNAGRTRGTMIALRPNQLHCRKSAEFGRGSAFAELPLTLQPITVSPDVSDDSPVPFVLARQKELKACATGTCDHPIHAIGDSALAPNVSSNSESQPASNSFATR